MNISVFMAAVLAGVGMALAFSGQTDAAVMALGGMLSLCLLAMAFGE